MFLQYQKITVLIWNKNSKIETDIKLADSLKITVAQVRCSLLNVFFYSYRLLFISTYNLVACFLWVWQFVYQSLLNAQKECSTNPLLHDVSYLIQTDECYIFITMAWIFTKLALFHVWLLIPIDTSYYIFYENIIGKKQASETSFLFLVIKNQNYVL